ncbi:cupin domain-containing protein [Pelagibius marinus]|uniref:cupin domain-containing protein n=1 Tax=Pelagibius marinus TaxID=2762760 RepID=UPI0029CA3366|nr:cupin domain-containing protein [Pelagibius marinus]
MTQTRNLLKNLPPPAPEEDFETLLQRQGVKLERIVSYGHTTPEAEWYDQEQDEWVMLLAGAARLLIDGEGETLLQPGDALLLPAHRRHRVTWTDPDRPTVWLALHLAGDETG